MYLDTSVHYQRAKCVSAEGQLLRSDIKEKYIRDESEEEVDGAAGGRGSVSWI